MLPCLLSYWRSAIRMEGKAQTAKAAASFMVKENISGFVRATLVLKT